MNKLSQNLLKVWLGLLAIQVCPTAKAFPTFFTPELSEEEFNLYVTMYNKQPVDRDFNRAFDIPLANQSIWPKGFDLDLESLEVGQTVNLFHVAVVPDDLDLEISSVKYASAIQAELNGTSLRGTVFLKSIQFEIGDEEDIAKLTDLFDGFDFEQLQSKHKSRMDTIFSNQAQIAHMIKELPEPIEGPNGHTNQKLARLMMQIDFAKINIFIQETEHVPSASNMPKLAAFPSLLGIVYNFDPAEKATLMNMPQRPSFRLLRKFGFFQEQVQSNRSVGRPVNEAVFEREQQIMTQSKSNNGLRGKATGGRLQPQVRDVHQEESASMFKKLSAGKMNAQVPILQIEVSEEKETIVSSVIVKMNGETLPEIEAAIVKFEHGVNLEKQFVYSNLISDLRRILI